MKANDIIAYLCGGIAVGERTCDTIKCGSPDKSVAKLAVTMVPTLDVLRKAAAEGVDMLIVHEPLFYDHMDMDVDAADPVIAAKQAVLAESGMTVFRYHDHPHARQPDLIVEGALRELGLSGELRARERFVSIRLSQRGNWQTALQNWAYNTFAWLAR